MNTYNVKSALLYREMPHMRHAKYQQNWPNGSGEEDVCMVFTIYGHDGNHEFRSMALSLKLAQ